MSFSDLGNPGVSRIKLIAVIAVCTLLYIGLAAFLIVSPADGFFAYIRSITPFMDFISGVLGDINKFAELIFRQFSLQLPLTGSAADNLPAFSSVMVLQDLCKLMVGSFVQSLLFIAFSYLFLGASKSVFGFASGRNTNPGAVGAPDPVNDLLYFAAHTLLYGISLLAGTLLGSFLIAQFDSLISGRDAGQRFWSSLLLFFVLFVLFSLYFMLRSNKNSSWLSGLFGLAKSAVPKFSFRRSLLKTFVCNLVPGIFTCLVTNSVIIYVFTVWVRYKFHIYTIAALLLLLAWSIVENILNDLLSSLLYKHPNFCGRRNPISGIFWLPATVCVVLPMYFMGASEMPNGLSGGGYYLLSLPYFEQWLAGGQPVTALLGNYPLELIKLLVLCTFAAFLQYLSSSYTATLFTQVFGRILIILGLLFALVGLFNVILYFGVPWIDSVNPCKYAGILLFILAFTLFLLLEPFVALQGILTSAGVILLLDRFPAEQFLTGSGGSQGLYLGALLIFMGVNLLASLIQNIVAFVEKKANRAISLVSPLR